MYIYIYIYIYIILTLHTHACYAHMYEGRRAARALQQPLCRQIVIQYNVVYYAIINSTIIDITNISHTTIIILIIIIMIIDVQTMLTPRAGPSAAAPLKRPRPRHTAAYNSNNSNKH